LSRLDSIAAQAAGSLPRDERGATFAEPWQAQAFALAVSLSANGHFTWSEWTAELGAELAHAARDGMGDSAYYERWLRALEKLVAEKRLATSSELRECARALEERLRHASHRS
jgi:nitrile hydratase accessory protein